MKQILPQSLYKGINPVDTSISASSLQNYKELTSLLC